VGDRPVNQVERGHVVEILSPIWLSKRETADRTLQRIDRVMSWAVGNDYRNSRVDMALVRDALPRRGRRKRSEIRRMPAIQWIDAPAFYAAIPMSRSVVEVRMAMTFYLLTIPRPGNIYLAKRGQIDLEAAIWHIPGEEMKGGEVHRIPLTPAALDIARAIMAMHDHELLFTVSGKPMSPDTLRMMMRRMGRTEVPHGFRSTFKDWARASGYPDDLSEMALAHADPNEVRAAYARDDLLEERRPMMLAWSEYLAGKLHIRGGIQRG
jgi:integrase